MIPDPNNNSGVCMQLIPTSPDNVDGCDVQDPDGTEWNDPTKFGDPLFGWPDDCGSPECNHVTPTQTDVCKDLYGSSYECGSLTTYRCYNDSEVVQSVSVGCVLSAAIAFGRFNDGDGCQIYESINGLCSSTSGQDSYIPSNSVSGDACSTDCHAKTPTETQTVTDTQTDTETETDFCYEVSDCFGSSLFSNCKKLFIGGFPVTSGTWHGSQGCLVVSEMSCINPPTDQCDIGSLQDTYQSSDCSSSECAPTPTSTLTDTVTNTLTDTVTDTLTDTTTLTDTLTDTVTDTLTDTVTDTLTDTVTDTLTNTVTDTESHTTTLTDTSTDTYCDNVDGGFYCSGCTFSSPGSSFPLFSPGNCGSSNCACCCEYCQNDLNCHPTPTDTLTDTVTDTETETLPDCVSVVYCGATNHYNAPLYTESSLPAGYYALVNQDWCIEVKFYGQADCNDYNLAVQSIPSCNDPACKPYTPTETQSDTLTDTVTDTVTDTLTDTLTDTVTDTLTNTVTDTDTTTDTLTDTTTDTLTDTTTDTLTDTVTDTDTTTDTLTDTGTETATDTGGCNTICGEPFSYCMSIDPCDPNNESNASKITCLGNSSVGVGTYYYKSGGAGSIDDDGQYDCFTISYYPDQKYCTSCDHIDPDDVISVDNCSNDFCRKHSTPTQTDCEPGFDCVYRMSCDNHAVAVGKGCVPQSDPFTGYMLVDLGPDLGTEYFCYYHISAFGCTSSLPSLDGGAACGDDICNTVPTETVTCPNGYGYEASCNCQGGPNSSPNQSLCGTFDCPCCCPACDTDPACNYTPTDTETETRSGTPTETQTVTDTRTGTSTETQTVTDTETQTETEKQKVVHLQKHKL